MLYRSLVGVFLMLLVGFSLLTATAAPESYTASFDAPTRSNLAQVDRIPITFTVIGSDARELPSQVRISIDYGQIITAEGARISIGTPYDLKLSDGTAHFTVSLEGKSDVPYPMNIYATVGDYGCEKVIAHAIVDIRYPTSIQVSEKSVLSAPADGKSTPIVIAHVFDQYKEPLEGAEIKMHLVHPDGTEMRAANTAVQEGESAVSLPSSMQTGYGVYQLECGGIASPTLFVAYGKTDSVMVPLRNLANRLGYSVHWDHTGKCAVVQDKKLRITVSAGSTVALVNSSPVPLGTPVLLSQGRIQIPNTLIRLVGGI